MFAMFLNSTYTLYIIIGVEVIVSVPCLLYYIGEEDYALFGGRGERKEGRGRESLDGERDIYASCFFCTSVQALWFNYMKQPPDVI